MISEIIRQILSLRFMILVILIFTLLSTIGLLTLTKFSFSSEKKGNIYSISLEEWEYTFARLTMVLMWISLGFFSLIILFLANFSFAVIFNCNRYSTLLSIVMWACIAFFIINIIGIIFLSEFCIAATVKNQVYTITLDKWQSDFSRVAIVGEWLSHIGIIGLSSYFLIN